MATKYWVGGSGTWDATTTTNWAITTGGAGGTAAPTNADTVIFDSNSGTAATVTVVTGAVSLTTSVNKSDLNLSLSSSCTLCTPAGTFTFYSGTLTLNNNILSTGVFSSNNSNIRAISFGTGSIALTSTTAATLVLDMSIATNCTFSGTGGFTRNQAATASMQLGTSGVAPTSPPNLTVNAGASALTLAISSTGCYFNNLIFTGSTCTVTASLLSLSGNLTLATGGTYTAVVPTFVGSGTITSNGKTLGATTINGSGITVTLGDAFTSSSSLTVTNGTFTTSASNYAVTATAISSFNSNIRTISLNGSTVTLSDITPISFAISANLTFNAGTSTINCTSASAISFQGGGIVFNNVSFTSTARTGAVTITGSNTFNTLLFAALASPGIQVTSLGASQTITTLTISSGADATYRQFFRSATPGTNNTLTVTNAPILVDVDFRDVTAAGASGTWSGTRLGNCGGNSNITFAAGVNKYWNLAAGGNFWTSIGWAINSGGTPAVNNFPLAQDTAIFESTGLNSGATITISIAYNIGSIDMSARTTNTMTLTISANIIVCGNWTNGTGTTISTAFLITFGGSGNTQIITTAGITFSGNVEVSNGAGTVRLASATTLQPGRVFTLTSGTLDLNGNILSTGSFSGSGSFARSIIFGTSSIALISTTAATIVLDFNNANNFTCTGTGGFTRNQAATATVRFGPTGASASNTVNLTVNAGASAFTINSSTYLKNIDFTGSTCTVTATLLNVCGNLTLASGGTYTAVVPTFIASGTLTTNTKTLPSLTVNGDSIIVSCADALTITGALTLSLGTIQLKSSATSTVGSFVTSGITLKYLQSTTSGTQATISATTGTFSPTYLSIKDSNATGGATWSGAGTGIINAGNNTGWTGLPPVTSNSGNFFLMFG